MSDYVEQSTTGWGARADDAGRASASPFLRRLQSAAGARHARWWEGPLLGAILLLSAALNLIGLSREGYANEYYAATVRSMLAGWHNFFFASFDPGGFVSVDKPPLGFMMQAISAKIFGFHGWSLLLPQALAGVASVALLYYLVRRVWGPLAGGVAALALAITPISVVTNRNNTIDSLLVLTLLGAAWAVTRAVESGRRPLCWLLLGGVLVGLGFTLQMLEAYLALPALWLAYLVAARARPLARIGHLVVATVVLLVVSLSWAVAVDLTPASQRPYVGSSQTNSELELAFGYNGLQRLFGNAFGRARSATDVSVSALLSNTNGFGVGGVSENGPKGVLRLLDTQLGGQIGWLVPLAVVGLLAAAWYVRPRRLRFWRQVVSSSGAGPLRRRRASLALWGGWFVTMAAFFSVAGFYHRYYLTMLAPGVAALAGLGVAVLWRVWRKGGWKNWLGWALPAALVGAAAVQAHILQDYPIWSARLALPVLGLSAAAALTFAAARLLRWRLGARSAWAMRPAQLALAVGLAALLLTPAVWSVISVQAASSGMAASLPVAGPAGSDRFGGMPGGFPGVAGQARDDGRGGRTFADGQFPFGAGAPPALNGAPAANGAFGAGQNRGGGDGMGQIDNQLLQWLIANQGNAKYVVAVSSSQQADGIIIQTGLPVMATGGFSGSDPILTADSLAQLVANGTVRYFLVGGGGPGGGFGRDGAGFSVTSWVEQHGTLVPASTWGGTSSGAQLYDLGATK
ncbi:MAG: glycosyltransferase family 39 protein [Thermomicrobiales bacterium]